MDDSYIAKGNESTLTADYASIITLQKLLFIVWVLGAISFFLYHIISYFIFKRKIKPYCSNLDSDILYELLDNMGIRSESRLLKCSIISSPMMIGFLKPIILLPDTKYSKNELAIILRHELTHYKRRDIWYKFLLIIANSIHWFNPFVYLMTRQANKDIEYSCDDTVVKNTDINFRKKCSMTILNAIRQD